ncbi:MAG TPA: hypothetical protein VFQ61_25870, partial [Polyangiaceae bacterium]|nr:hypothetical protein [Polyangiaceae bacterium]
MSHAKSPSLRLAMTTAVLALAHQVGAKTVREGVFLSTYSSANLPTAMFGSALCSIPAAFVVSRAMTRWGPQRAAPALFAASALLWLLEWFFLPTARGLVAALLFLHVSVGGALLVSAFWSVVSERFDPHALKTQVTKIGAAATLGGLLGGALTERTSRYFHTRSTLLLLAGICLTAALFVWRLSQRRISVHEESVATGSPRLTPYLRNTALLVTCAALAGTFTDFALKNAAAQHFTRAEDLVRFFALFYTGSSLVGFLLQAFIAPRLLSTFGIGATLSATPLGVLLLGTAAALSPSMVMLGTLKAAEAALSSSLFRSAYEPLFTPLASATKRRAKSLIDVVFDKGGDALGALVIMAILWGGPTLLTRAPASLAALAAAAGLHLALQAQRGYVTELEARLRTGTLSVRPDELTDPAAKLALSATAVGLDRTKLLEEIRRLNENTNAESKHLADQADRLSEELRVLLGSDFAAAERVLGKRDLDPRLAAFVIPLLGVRPLARAAAEALRRLGPMAVALMAEGMLSPDLPVVVKRRIPHVLRSLKGEAVVEALTQALRAGEFSVRTRAALALREV